MLENGIIEPSCNAWASPCVLVDKPDGLIRFCTDYRNVNRVTATDAYPVPRMDDCIDMIGNAKFITKCDLLKRYCAVPLSEKTKVISTFVTPDGSFTLLCYAFWTKEFSSDLRENDGSMPKSHKRRGYLCGGHTATYRKNTCPR